MGAQTTFTLPRLPIRLRCPPSFGLYHHSHTKQHYSLYKTNNHTLHNNLFYEGLIMFCLSLNLSPISKDAHDRWSPFDVKDGGCWWRTDRHSLDLRRPLKLITWIFDQRQVFRFYIVKASTGYEPTRAWTSRSLLLDLCPRRLLGSLSRLLCSDPCQLPHHDPPTTIVELHLVRWAPPYSSRSPDRTYRSACWVHLNHLPPTTHHVCHNLLQNRPNIFIYNKNQHYNIFGDKHSFESNHNVY